MRRRSSGPAGSVLSEHQPLEAVDAALSKAARSKLMSSGEALQTLRDVQAAVVFDSPDALVDQIIAEAARSYSDQLVIDRAQLVNPLLDIRLTICH
ncbi:MAG: hypothetical protein ACXVKA_06170 [Acidimicrobiia bacterium]